MTVYLLAVSSLVLLFLLAGASVFFVLRYGSLKKRCDEAVDKSMSERDGLIKNSIRLEEEIKSLQGRLDALSGSLKEANVLSEKLREEDRGLYAKVSRLTADNENLHEKIGTQKTDYESRLEKQKNEFLELESRFKEAFENLSSKMLEDRSKKFLEINKENISGILNPLSQKIAEFQKKVEETYDKESKQRFSLQTEIGRLVEVENTMKKAAENLTTALKGSGKVQGDWGEMILEQLLEYSGLTKGFQYEIQKELETTDESGEKINLRPDVVVHLPMGRDLIIDSKVSLTDYERYMSASNPGSGRNAGNEGGVADAGLISGNTGDAADRQASDADKFLKSHINSIKKHINELSAKNYSKLLKSNSLDAVIMFIPIEFAYTAAVNSDDGRDILNYAAGKNVIIATPSLIILVLKIVYSLWIQEKSMEKAVEVMRMAGQLYDKFCSFGESMENIGKSLDRTREAYDNARSQLVSGKGNIMGRFEKMKRLGAKAVKSLDRDKFEQDEENGNGYEELIIDEPHE